MYQGKYISSGKLKYRRRLRLRKEFALLCSVAVLLVGVIGGSLAYLIANGGSVLNSFTPAKPGVEIEEGFDGQTKTDVKARNTGEFPVYVRASYVAYWVSDAEDTKGTVLPEIPELTSSFGDDWTKNEDGYWYYNKILAAGEVSTNFINSMTADKMDDRHLVVDVIMETVQADGAGADGKTPVEDLWGFIPGT